MSLLDSLFSFFKPATEVTNPTKGEARRPRSTDFSAGLVCNHALTYGLYHNSYPGMKLAGSMAFNPIAVPVWFMGYPVVTPKDETDEELAAVLEGITEKFLNTIKDIHIQTHRDGTVWVWPFFSQKESSIGWELIEDEAVTDVIRDLNTGAIIKVITDEEIKVTSGYDKTATVRRRREFTETKVEVTWKIISGELPAEVRDVTYRNAAGVIPIPFTNNKDGSEVRGHSDYERIITDLKDYHDIDYAQSQTLAKFRAKMVQTVKNYKTWQETNGIENINELHIDTIDFIFNLPDEKTEFIFPAGAHEAYEAGLKRKFKKIVEGSGIPEMLWGTKVEGNHATAEEQMGLLIKFVQDKQEQKNESYLKLYSATVSLIKAATIAELGNEINISWNPLDAVSEKVRAEIFTSYANGISALINSGGATKEFIHNMTMQMYPGMSTDDYEKYIQGLSEMAKHKVFLNTPYEVIADMEGAINLDDEEPPPPTLREEPENRMEMPLTVIVNQPPAPESKITVNVPEIKIPEQPPVVVNMPSSGKKNIKLIRDSKGNIERMESDEA